MYIPTANRLTDPGEIRAFLGLHSFATLVTCDDSVPFATHLPVLHHEDTGTEGRLVSHIARANPQWRHFKEGQDVLVIFQGPHAYISPAWYEAELAVPTWNYAAVHVYGVPKLITEPERVAAVLEELVEYFEKDRADRWAGNLPEEYKDRMMQGMVAFEIRITRVEAKYKLSQNRPAQDIMKVVAALSQSPDQTERELAALMAKVASGHGSLP